MTFVSHRRLIRVALPSVSLLLLGCATPHDRPDQLYWHAIRFDEDGHTLDPRTGRQLGACETVGQLKAIRDHMASELSGHATRRILIFVHGGLNTPDDALDAAVYQMNWMGRAKVDWYPIYVIWDSSLGATYKEHLFAVRQGRKDAQTKASAAITWPIYLACDLMRAAARSPTVWMQQRATDDAAWGAALASIFSYIREEHIEEYRRYQATLTPEQKRQLEYVEAWMNYPRNANALAFYKELNRRYAADFDADGHRLNSQIAISIGKDYSQPWDWVGRGLGYAVTLPTKMLTAPLLDALGSSAWQDMERRTQTILEGSSDFVVDQNTTQEDIRHYVDVGTDGGLDRFIADLAKFIHDDAGNSYEVTLMGHSMGAMVINEILRRQAARERLADADANNAALPVKNIVYMAAACSIRDFRAGVIPFMQQHNHQDAQFYNLCLHPTAEVLETNVGDLPPRGSLLCWLDDFLTDPYTPLDRTLGRWQNLLQVPYVIPPDVRGRVNIKAFAMERSPNDANLTGRDPQPQHHGDFTLSPYWDEKFWQPGPPLPTSGGRMRIVGQEQKQLAPAPTTRP